MSYVYLILCATVVLFYVAFTRSNEEGSAKPPGPKSLPFIGNFHSLPKRDVAEEYARWNEIYGPVSYFHVFGREFVLLNTFKAARDLFEKRSHLYSERPRLVMAGELVGREKSILFTSYGDRLKSYRRILNNFLSKRSLPDYWPSQEAHVSGLLHELMLSPACFVDHFRFHMSALTLNLIYGYEAQHLSDPFLQRLGDVSRITTEASEPGRWLVDSFPIMRHIPSWFPGAHFQRWAANARNVHSEYVCSPHKHVKDTVMSGSPLPSWTSKGLFDKNGNPVSDDEEDLLMWCMSSAYLGAGDTTQAALLNLTLLMVNHPEIQSKAQAEIDKNIPHCRLPGMHDKDVLPYVQNMILESLRFHPPVPITPHSLSEDDIYEGMLIPKKSWVMANIWAMTHDESIYPEPHLFNPDRYESSPKSIVQPSPAHIIFGFGRRLCPGYDFGLDILFIVVSRILSAFNITPATDANGANIPAPLEYEDGHVSFPKAFNCSFKLRSDTKRELIEQAVLQLS